MIASIRHNISLVVSLAGMTAGLIVLIYGAIHLIGATVVFFTITNAPFDVPGFQVPAAMMILVQHAITALAGAALLYFAGKGFVQRWRAGPPADDTVIGKSSLSQSLALIIYGAGALYGGYGIVFGMGPLLDDYQLAINGDKTTARFVSMEPAPEIHWDVQRVHYQFTTRDGQQVDGYANKFSYPAKQMMDSGFAEVTYDPQNPERSEVDFSFSLQFALYFFGGQLIFVIIGIWGFAKNARALSDSPGMPPPISRVVPDQPRPAPVARPTVAGSVRKQFGRRGA